MCFSPIKKQPRKVVTHKEVNKIIESDNGQTDNVKSVI